MLITARFVATMDAPLLRDAAVLVRAGRIERVGRAVELASEARGVKTIDLGRALVMPGLVNPHTHLELSRCRAGDSPGGHFGDWILRIREQLRAQGEDFDGVIAAAVDEGVRQCQQFGVTTVGDISQQNHLTRPRLRNAKLRVVSYGETLGLGMQRARHDELLSRALDASCASETLRIALSPHSPYTVDLDGYRACIEAARQRSLPLATHLAENPEEHEFLQHQTGLFRRIWESLAQWADPVPTLRASPVRFAHEIGLLEYPTLLAHLNYCDDEELKLLSRGRASVVYCPRTHAYFGHPPHRWREMLSREINVAVGTDSCASSPDLNLVDELRLLRRIAPDAPARTLWEMATIRAAQAVGMQDEVGSLTAGKRADLVTFAVDAGEPDPLGAILLGEGLPSHVWLAGEPAVDTA
jgi:cytosine/adenosine deaminase-related metal-dependent hydrolase